MSIIAIETNREVAGKLEMLLLIFADRNQIGLIEQYIRGHQHRIIEEADEDVLFLLAGLIFELRHAFQLGHARDAVKQPRQLSVRGHIRLHKHGRNIRINANGKIDSRELTRFCGEHLRILRQRDGVKIYDTEKTLIVTLERHPITQSAEIISQMNVAGRLRAAEDSFHLQIMRQSAVVELLSASRCPESLQIRR